MSAENALSYVPIGEEFKEKINEFECGKDIVDEYLKESALKLHDIRKVTTHLVFSQDNNLIGFFSLFNESVTVVKSKRDQQQWDDIRDEKSVFPAIRLHYFGVDSKYQKNGFGEQILFHLVSKVKEISDTSGCIFITLETHQDTFDWYEKRLFTYLKRSDHDNSLYNMCLRIKKYFSE